MKPVLKLLLIFAAVFLAAYAAERAFVPGIVPVAFADAPQALWAVEAAFILRSVQYVAAGGAFLVLAFLIASVVRKSFVARGR